MKKILQHRASKLVRTAVICFSFLIFCTSKIFSTPLCGTYTVGGASPNFVDLNAAINSLNTNGVSCAVTFNLRAGTYTAGQTINSIPGSSTINTVTFESESGIAADVTLTSIYYDITLNNASNIKFLNLTFSAANDYYNVAGIYTNYYTYDQNIILDHCVFNIANSNFGYNSYGIYAYYSDCSGMQVTHCTFNTVWYAVYIYGYPGYPNNGIVVNDNVMTGAYYGVYGYYLGDIQVLRNQISLDWPSYTSYGVYLYYTPRFNIEKNIIITTSSSGGADGVYLYYCNGVASPRNTLINNFIQVDGSSTSYGIYLYYVSFLNVYNNSVNNICTDPNSSAYYRYQGDHINIVNNIFDNSGGGYAIYVTGSGPTINYDYNDYYVTGSYLGYFNGSYAVDLPSWRVLYGLDAHSISADPTYASPTDLHASNPALIAGQPNGVTDDIDGEPRSGTTPVIGADEFSPAANIPTLSQWGLMAMFVLLPGIGMVFLRRNIA